MDKNIPEDLAKAIEDFEKAQNRYRKCGAEDTEPDGEFHGIIYQAIDNKDVNWSQLDWQLYDMPQQLEANLALTNAAKVVYNLVKQYNNNRNVVEQLKDYAWRMS